MISPKPVRMPRSSRAGRSPVQEASLPPLRAGAPRLRPVENVTLQQRVYEQLRTALMTGRFLPGEVVTLRGLAAELGTSAMPVRESLMRLVAERAMELLPNRSIRVAVKTRRAFLELFEVRALLEGEAAARAASLVTDAELAELADMNRTIRSGMDRSAGDAVIPTNQRFHFAIYRAARSAVLLPVIETLWLQSGPYLMEPFRRPAQAADLGAYMAAGANRHRQILEALDRRDGEAAREAIAGDIGDAAAWYAGAMQFAPEAVTGPEGVDQDGEAEA